MMRMDCVFAFSDIYFNIHVMFVQDDYNDNTNYYCFEHKRVLVCQCTLSKLKRNHNFVFICKS